MKKYVLVGTGARGLYAYAKTIAERHAEDAALVGFFDINKTRCAYARDQVSPAIPIFDDFDRMMDAVRPDVAIITTVDRYHKEYILRTFAHGCDVICEKPLTIEAGMLGEILQAEKQYGRKVAVTFNCRFIPFFIKLKELMRGGAVGEVLHADMEWFLDTSHGADYFRRWHRRLHNSGGLLVHKATHHFDVVNWLIEQDPVAVFASGNLRFYGPTREKRGERCATCAYTATCEFAYPDAQEPWIRALYFDAEADDGYYRDRCVFADEIDIYDTMSVAVKYHKNALLTYSLVAYSPYEGWRLTINGTGGRLEAQSFYSGPQAQQPCDTVKVFDRHGNITTVEIEKKTGSHGGSDAAMLSMLIRGAAHDPLNQCATSREGALSAIIGIAANESIRTGGAVHVADLLPVL